MWSWIDKYIYTNDRSLKSKEDYSMTNQEDVKEVHHLGNFSLLDYIRHTKNKKISHRKYCFKNKEKINRNARDHQRRNVFDVDFIYKMLLKNNKNKKRGKSILSRDEFIKWWNAQEKKCFYCDIKEEDLKDSPSSTIFKNKKTRRLTIDRLDSSKGYELNNILLACMRCNVIKSNFFNVEEMREIGQRYVKPKWEKEIKKLKFEVKKH